MAVFNPPSDSLPTDPPTAQDTAKELYPGEAQAQAILATQRSLNPVVSGACGSFDDKANCSGRQLRALLRAARTAQDHERLADYFWARAREFRAKQARQREVWVDLMVHPTTFHSKQPARTGSDAAAYMIDCYAKKERQAAAMASEQERFALGMHVE